MLNACDPRLNPPIFDGAFAAGCTYLDMAMHLSKPHPERPYEETGVKLGDAQFAVADRWEAKGQLALVGIGVEPGLSDVFARYAADHLFSSIDEVGVRDGANLVIDGYDFAPTFSIWTTIEECLNPPVIWERDRGWYTTAPFSEPETFDFPEGIGPVECVNVEHEEVLLVPRWVDCERVTFKYGLGDEFIEVLEVAAQDRARPHRHRCACADVEVAPRDVVAATLPEPGRARRPHARQDVRRHVGDAAPAERRAARSTYLYHVVDNDEVMAEYGHQAVVWQTAINPVVALELLASGHLVGRGRARPRGIRRAAVPRPAHRVRQSLGHQGAVKRLRRAPAVGLLLQMEIGEDLAGPHAGDRRGSRR